MKVDNFYKETLILSISNLTMGILRFIFSVILSNKLGSEGLGLYSLVMPIYDLFCCLTCGGLIAAISRKGAEFHSLKKYRNLIKVIKVTLVFDLIWSTIISLVVFFSSPLLATGIINDARAIYSLKLISPAIIFVSISNVLKGYFYSVNKAAIPAYIDIFEKFVRISVVLISVSLISHKDLTTTVTVVYGSLLAGEAFSFLLLYIFYKSSTSKLKYISSEKRESSTQLIFDILVVFVPLCINSFLTSIIGTASTLILPRRLVAAGIGYKEALSMIGEFNGMAFAITFFPNIVIASMSTLLIPDISKFLTSKNYYELEKRVSQVIKISLFIGISTLIISLCIPTSLGKLFFGNDHLGPYIKAAALSAPFFYILSTSFGILSGLGRQKLILRNSIIISIVELVLLYILSGITSINIYGMAIAFIIMSMVGVVLNLYEINKFVNIHFSVTEIVIYLMTGVLVYFILGILNNLIPVSLFKFKVIVIMITGFSVFSLIAYLGEKNIK
ncbi:MAG: stage V sporulation protein B [Clostridiaceae bacterium]